MPLHGKLEQRLVQKLILTPSLQQAIKLLQLTRIELKSLMDEQLETNPVLEDVLSLDKIKDDPLFEEMKTEKKDEEDFDIAAFFQHYSEQEPPLMGTPLASPSVSPVEYVTGTVQKLVDYLLWQIQLMEVPPRLIRPITFLIASLNEDGYLIEDLSSLAEESGFSREELDESLHLIQSLDPTGVGARSSKECLLLQTSDPMTRKVIQNYWDDFIHQDEEKIMAEMGLSADEVDAVRETIKRLDLYPGRSYSQETPIYIEPDVYVIRKGVHHTIMLNEDGMPHLRVNRHYLSIYENALNRKDEETAAYVQKKLQSAIWFLKSVEQRHRTLYKVSKSLVTLQKDFFDHGTNGLKPLTLKRVAEDIHVHESTVSRVVANKYMQTPHGLIAMRSLFLQGVPMYDGKFISVARVQEIIKKIISGETPVKPLSDAGVAEIIQNRYHIQLARRTVAKYREEMGIPSSKERKQIS